MLKPIALRTHTEMKDVLKNPEMDGPETHYYMVRGGDKKRNITIWETGKVGDEYIKTFGHYHIGDLDETYTILEGEGIAVLQKRKISESEEIFDNKLEYVYLIKVKAGDKIFIPSGTGHLVCNTGKTWLVTSDDSPVNFEEADPVSLPGHADYETVREFHGFGYYIVESEGEAKAVPNENYEDLPEPEWLTSDEYKQKFYPKEQNNQN